MREKNHAEPRNEGLVNRFQSQIKRTLTVQLCVVIFVSLAWLIHGVHNGIAAFFGGLTALLGNVFFAWRLFRRMSERSAQQILLSLYLNEILKLIGCAIMVLILLRIFHLAVIPLLSGLLAAYLVVAPMAIYQQIKMVRR